MNNNSASDIHRLRNKTDEDRGVLEHRLFHLQILADLTRDVSGVIQPRKIMESYLLSAMGAIGFSSGFVLLKHTASAQPEVVTRGLLDDQPVSLLLESPLLSGNDSSYFHHFPSIQMLDDRSLLGSGVPDRTELVLRWTVNPDCSGLLGLGGRISPAPLTSEESEFLLTLANSLSTSLNRTLAEENIRLLNSELVKRNEELGHALQAADQAKNDLDRRVFHLNALYAAHQELHGILESDKLLEPFLLTVMGTFSVQQGQLLLLDRKARNVISASRGITPIPRSLKAKRIENLIYQCLRMVEEKSVAPMSVRELRDPSSLTGPEFPFQISTALMLVFDESLMGILAIGEPLWEEELSGDELTLMRTMTTNFMASVINARDVETIRELNVELSRSNELLRRTIEDLTAAQNRIELLETAKARIRALVDRETERAGRVSWYDFLVIIGLSLVVGLLFNFSNPAGVSLLPEHVFSPPTSTIPAGQAADLFAADAAVFVDARPTPFFEQKHIPGAVNLPTDLFDFVYGMKMGGIDMARPVVVYGRTISKRYDFEVAAALLSRGHTHVRIIEGGLSSWEKSGSPLETEDTEGMSP